MTTSERSSSRYSGPVLSARARGVSFGDDTLVVDLEDGRQISVPIAWFPRLAEAMSAHPNELHNWRLDDLARGYHSFRQRGPTSPTFVVWGCLSNVPIERDVGQTGRKGARPVASRPQDVRT